MADKLDSLVQSNSGSTAARGAAGAQDVSALGPDDLLDQLVKNQTDVMKLNKQQSEVATPTQNLGSLGSILALLGAGGAAALGGQGGMDVAAGLAGGVLGGAQQKTAEEVAAIGGKKNQLMDLLEQNKQRLTTMLTSRPELFVDSETGESLVDPRLLSFAATGYLMPINPGINYKLSLRSDRNDRLASMGIQLALNGDTAAKRKQGGMLLNQALGTSLPPDFFEAIATMDESSAWGALAGNSLLKTESVLLAWKFATENGLPMSDPKVVTMMQAAEKDTTATKFTMDDEVITLNKEFQDWLAEAGTAIQNLPLAQQLDAWGGDERQGDSNMLKRYFIGTNVQGAGIDGQDLMALTNGASKLLETVWVSTQGQSPMLKEMGVTDEAAIYGQKGVGKLVAASIGSVQEANENAFGQKEGRLIRRIAEKIAYDASVTGREITTDQAFQEASDRYAEIRGGKDMVSPTGQLDVDKLVKAVQAYVETAQ